MPTHREIVRKRTRVAQTAALVLLACCVGVAFVDVGSLVGGLGGDGGEVGARGQRGGGADQDPGDERTDLRGLIDSVTKLGPTYEISAEKPEPAERPVARPPVSPNGTGPGALAGGENAGGGGGGAGATAVSALGWRYLGHMRTPSTVRAIVDTAGDGQVALRVGDSLGEVKLVSVRTDHILIDPGSGDHERVDLVSGEESAAGAEPIVSQPSRQARRSDERSRGIGRVPGSVVGPSITNEGFADLRRRRLQPTIRLDELDDEQVVALLREGSGEFADIYGALRRLELANETTYEGKLQMLESLGVNTEPEYLERSGIRLGLLALGGEAPPDVTDEERILLRGRLGYEPESIMNEAERRRQREDELRRSRREQRGQS